MKGSQKDGEKRTGSEPIKQTFFYVGRLPYDLKLNDKKEEVQY